MEFLGKSQRLLVIVVALLLTSVTTAQPLTGVNFARDLGGQVIYSVALPDPNGLGRVIWDMALDPVSGDLFIGQNTDSGGNILRVDPAQGSASELPFFSQGLAFAADGTLYFGVSNLLFGVWQRQQNIFRKFATIPSVRGAQVMQDGTLYVAEGDFGPQGLFPDTILKVDRGDGFFTPVFDTAVAQSQIGAMYSVMTSMAVDGGGNIYAGFHSGQLVRRSPAGNYTELNRRLGLIGGLNEFPLSAGSDGVVYQYDITAGEIFAYLPTGEIFLVAYGNGLEGGKFSNGGIASDGRHLYVVNDAQRLLEIAPTAGGTLLSVFKAAKADASMSGRLVDGNGVALAGVRVLLQNGDETISAADGTFSLTEPEDVYELKLLQDNFRTQVFNLTLVAGTPLNLGDISMASLLPATLAPGLVADLIANNANDGINGASDVVLGPNGNLFTMNFSSGTITRIDLDPTTRERSGSAIVAQGGNLSNSFIVTVDGDGNVWASTGNTGVLKLPPRNDGQTYVLSVSTGDNTKVTDQNGVNRVVSKVSDVDGIAQLSNGNLYFSSGASGAPTQGFPGGTFNTIVEHTPANTESIYSRGGVQPGGAGPVQWANNDILKSDPQDRLMVGDRTGSLFRVNSDGSVELIWPGDGAGKADGAGAFSGLNDDGIGHLFIRGENGSNTDSMLRMIAADNISLLTVVGGLSFNFGGFTFEHSGRTLYIADDQVIVRIRSLDNRSIADNLLNPPPAIPPTPRFAKFTGSRRLDRLLQSGQVRRVKFGAAGRPLELDYRQQAAQVVPAKLLPAENNSPAPTGSKRSGGGGSPGLFFLILVLLGGVRSLSSRSAPRRWWFAGSV